MLAELLIDAAVTGIIVVAFWQDSTATRARRAAYLARYPSLDSVRAVIDPDKYRQIRDHHGRTGVVQAARAIKRDFPGMTVAESAEIISGLAATDTVT